jgi:hypothetical protein
MTSQDYKLVVTRLIAKGYTAETAYPALEACGFTVEIEGVTYEGIYASRVIAMMHEQVTKPKALVL